MLDSPVVTPLCSPDDWAERRVLVVVAHPDDEILGCGAILATLGDVRIVQVTDGAPSSGADAARLGFADRAAYARVRHAESLVALTLAGLSADCLVRLGVADQEASMELASIARQLGPSMSWAEVVLTHAYEGGHADHDAVAFAVHAARDLVGASAALVEMPFYFADDAGWVRQRFLPISGSAPPVPVSIRALSPAERELKARMIAAHATQRETLAGFALDAERFRPAPDYDFAGRPHFGPLLYERHGWNLTWDLWTDRVQAARATLGLTVR